jgi:hypothetical protein
MDLETDQWAAEFADIPELGEVENPTLSKAINYDDAINGACHKLHSVVLRPCLNRNQPIPWRTPGEPPEFDAEVRNIAVAY